MHSFSKCHHLIKEFLCYFEIAIRHVNRPLAFLGASWWCVVCEGIWELCSVFMCCWVTHPWIKRCSRKDGEPESENIILAARFKLLGRPSSVMRYGLSCENQVTYLLRLEPRRTPSGRSAFASVLITSYRGHERSNRF